MMDHPQLLSPEKADIPVPGEGQGSQLRRARSPVEAGLRGKGKPKEKQMGAESSHSLAEA